MIVLLGTLLISFGCLSAQDSDLVVRTTGGLVRGSSRVSSVVENMTVYGWRNLPYAEPPVGKLRFRPPVPKAAWTDTLDVSDPAKICVQFLPEFSGAEDCLYLALYTIHKPSLNKKLPVVVWIHGGSFWYGSEFDGVGVDHMLAEGVIMVGIRYRLGSLGFLTTANELLPGNNALRDQILAMQWVNANIERFGGDPNKITMAGQSAGAVAVAYLMQTPQAKGLFSKAILHSQSTLSTLIKPIVTVSLVKDLGKQLNLNTQNTAELVEQLRNVNIQDLQNASLVVRDSIMFRSSIRDGLVYFPSLEPEYPGALITRRSYQQLASGNYMHLPTLTGFTSNEVILEDLPAPLRPLWVRYENDTKLFVPISLHANNWNKIWAGKEIRNHFFGRNNISASPGLESQFSTDDVFHRPITKAAEFYSLHSKVYFYQFSYKGLLSGNPDTNRAGPNHAEDMAYLFDYPFNGTTQDYLVKQRMIKLWTNFIKTGNPTPEKEPLLENVIWPANNGQRQLKFLNIDHDLTIINPPNQSNMNFWEYIFRKYGRPPYDSY